MKTVRRLAGQVAAVMGASSGLGRVSKFAMRGLTEASLGEPGTIHGVRPPVVSAPRFLAWAVREWVRVHMDSLREWVWPSRPATR
jgi:hypothetical protein